MGLKASTLAECYVLSVFPLLLPMSCVKKFISYI